jgi:hypothetical protein
MDGIKWDTSLGVVIIGFMPIIQISNFPYMRQSAFRKYSERIWLMSKKNKFGSRACEVLYTTVPHGEALLQMHRNEKDRSLIIALEIESEKLLEKLKKIQDEISKLAK